MSFTINDSYRVEPTLFPDRTSQIWKLPEEILKLYNVTITWDYSSEADIIHLAQLKMLFDHHDINSKLIINYLPYARQDKAVSNSSTFALKTFAKLLNSLNFTDIRIMDPHSQIALDLIRDSEANWPVNIIMKITNELRIDLFCYPDNGAVSKYTKIYNYKYIYGEKIRDQLTGNILSYKLIGDVEDKNVLICDDLIDGGATFILLTKQLLEAGAKEVNLFATHGIFSKGTKKLFESGIKHIFTKDGEVIGENDQNQPIYRIL
jgi:ribose-phosphate pyrophosphokinase